MFERISYEECDHPEKKKAPLPCTGWCKRIVLTPDGHKTEELMPFLNESFGKKVVAGVNKDGAVVYANTLTFDDPNFITSVENMPEIDEVTGKPKRQSDGSVKIAFKFVAGVHAQSWSGVWLQRLFNMQEQLLKTTQMVVNNTAAVAQILNKMNGADGIQPVAPGASMPSPITPS